MAATSPFTFTGGFVSSRIQTFVLSVIDELEQDGIENAEVLEWVRGDFFHYGIKWPAVALVTVEEPDLEVLVLRNDGRIHLAGPNGLTEESVDDGPEGPEGRGFLRDMRVIAGDVYVAGMARQVYRRDAPGAWVRIDQGALVERGSGEIAGFNSIDGFGREDLYAVGFDGEIWRYDGKRWTELDSPSFLPLSRVKCVAPDTVYACGRSGELLRGRGDDFEVIDHKSTEENLWGLEWFGDKLYVASYDRLFVLDGGALVPVDLGLDKPMSHRYLHANDGVLWSIGMKDLAYTDGKTWYEVVVP